MAIEKAGSYTPTAASASAIIMAKTLDMGRGNLDFFVAGGGSFSSPQYDGYEYNIIGDRRPPQPTQNSFGMSGGVITAPSAPAPVTVSPVPAAQPSAIAASGAASPASGQTVPSRPSDIVSVVAPVSAAPAGAGNTTGAGGANVSGPSGSIPAATPYVPKAGEVMTPDGPATAGPTGGPAPVAAQGDGAIKQQVTVGVIVAAILAFFGLH